MKYVLPVVLAIVLCMAAAFAQEPAAADSLRAPADTMFVIPAGPVAGSFTSAARLSIIDTIAGWAKIQVEGWVPVQAISDRLAAPGEPHSLSNAPPSSGTAAPRAQCAAMTKKGTRCKRMAQPGSKYCWQHQPSRAK